jgi:hypothetical protein
MLDIAKTLFDLGKGLFGIRGELEKARKDRRDRAAEYFSNIARLIEETSALLKKKQYPHGKCAELEQLALLMPQTLKGVMADENIEGHKEALLSVRQIELLFNDIQPLQPRAIPKKLAKLDEAAGYFRALAAHLRVV